jgi:hypothetical protein
LFKAVACAGAAGALLLALLVFLDEILALLVELQALGVDLGTKGVQGCQTSLGGLRRAGGRRT